MATAPGLPAPAAGRAAAKPRGPRGVPGTRAATGHLPTPTNCSSEVESSGLVGRGGAAFPLAVKLRAVRDNGRRAGGTVVVANGEEGEPASIKDRWLLRNRPHLVLDGLRLAAAIVAADSAYVYVSDPESARSVEAALRRARPRRVHGITVELVTVQPGLRGRRGDRRGPGDQRRPGQADGQATAPVRSRRRRTAHAGEQRRDAGQPALPAERRLGRVPLRRARRLSPGTFLATITGAGRPPVLYELPHGLPFTELLALHGVSPDQVRGALMGGYFAGLLNRRVLETRWTTRPCAGSAAAWAAARSR